MNLDEFLSNNNQIEKAIMIYWFNNDNEVKYVPYLGRELKHLLSPKLLQKEIMEEIENEDMVEIWVK